MENGAPVCTPEDEEVLRKDGFYPSGHTALGWAWALILTEIAPDRADAILARGRAFGVSRNICNVHWHSDVETFGNIWSFFKHGEAALEIDFTVNLVLYSRNTMFFNRNSIMKVNVTHGVAQVVTMETMSAMPVEDKVAMSMVVIPRSCVAGIRNGDEIIPVAIKH